MQKVKETTDKHLVFVADSDGINTVFLMLVERLKDDRLYGEHLTLLYVSDNYGFVFKEELDILTKRFPTRFLTCYESSHRQETLEAIINTNTKKQMEFHLDLAEEERHSICSELHFLGIDNRNIHIITHQLYQNN